MGIFQTLVDKYKAAKQKSLNKQFFRKAFLKAAADGSISLEEMSELDKLKAEFGLTDGDFRGLKAEAYTTAFAAAKSDNEVTKEEESELHAIQKLLGLSDGEIHNDKKELARLRLLNEIRQGNMPVIRPVMNLITLKSEKVYWAEPVILVEEKVIRRRYQGGSQGISLRVMKGVSFRIGGHRGHIESETGLVDVCEGELILTSRRAIFRGEKKSFASKLENILDLNFYSDGIRFSENNKSRPRLLKFKVPGNRDIIGAVLSHAINNYGNK
ncbi:MAG: hypothetical protein QY323_01410 [Patescibacteria group bacterium]|nr:MAG: hypothetical protein QY323_01410 [Patescibacteria group bacterium]